MYFVSQDQSRFVVKLVFENTVPCQHLDLIFKLLQRFVKLSQLTRFYGGKDDRSAEEKSKMDRRIDILVFNGACKAVGRWRKTGLNESLRNASDPDKPAISPGVRKSIAGKVYASGN